MATTNLQGTLNWFLIRSSMTAKQSLMKLAEAYDLTLMQVLALCLLEPSKPVPMSTISEQLICDPSNVTGIVERLTQGNYVERRESTHDRRVKTITLTATGEKLLQQLLPAITENDIAGLHNLSPEEIVELKRLLKKLLPVSASAKQLESIS